MTDVHGHFAKEVDQKIHLPSQIHSNNKGEINHRVDYLFPFKPVYL